jgi:hypothetical protein
MPKNFVSYADSAAFPVGHELAKSLTLRLSLMLRIKLHVARKVEELLEKKAR